MQTLQQRKAKFFLVLPVIVIPLLTLLFWKFGGGSAQAASSKMKGGYNFQLPEAAPENQDNWTKLDYYKKAEQDSAKIKAYSKKDPAYILANNTENAPEEKVYRKLRELEVQLADEEEEIQNKPLKTKSVRDQRPTSTTSDVQRLERMMQHIQQNPPPDPEIEQLNEMLNKLAGLENPAANSLAPTADSVHAFALPVIITEESHAISSTLPEKQFFGLATEDLAQENTQLIIKAIIDQDQSIVSGSTVSLTLLQPVKIGKLIIPQRHRIHATATIQQNRLQLSVKGIVFSQQLLPVTLMAVDQTGSTGIMINNRVAGEFTQQTAQRSIGSIGFNSINPTIEGQIAEAGLQTAKSLFNKKTKAVTVALRAGDEVWLVDQTTRK